MHYVTRSKLIQFLFAVPLLLGACDRIVPADQPPIPSQISEPISRTRENSALLSRAVLDDTSGFIGIIGANGVSLDSKGGALEVASTGNDPWVLLPPVVIRPGAQFAVRIDQTSLVATTLEIFYTTDQTSGFSQAHALAVPVEAGRSTVLFVINHPGFTGGLRFDPGRQPGTYGLHSVEFFASEAITLKHDPL